MSGDSAQDYVGPGVAEDIITMLSSYPTLRVVSRTSSFAVDENIRVQQIGKELGVDYVIEGSVRKSGDRVRVTAQLIDAATEEHVWADRYDEEGADVTAMQDAVAYRIYSTVAGLRGEIRQREESAAWSKPGPSLEEYDYYLRGHQLFFRFTQEDNAKAREIWQEGLSKFPDSALLRTKIAFTYMQDVVRERTDDPWSYTELGWKLAKEAEAIPNKSGLEELLTHWVLAYFYWLHEGNFERSAEEAELTAALVPNDSFTRADVAQFLINAGRPQEAIEWIEEAIRHDPNPMEWYFGNLAFAYYVAGRPADAIVQLQKMKSPWRTLLAAAYVRDGQLGKAQAIMAEFSRDYPNYRLQDEAVWPTWKQPQFAEVVLKPYLDDLAKAGLRGK
jgi:TolB-like protein